MANLDLAPLFPSAVAAVAAVAVAVVAVVVVVVAAVAAHGLFICCDHPRFGNAPNVFCHYLTLL